MTHYNSINCNNFIIKSFAAGIYVVVTLNGSKVFNTYQQAKRFVEFPPINCDKSVIYDELI